MAGKRGGEGKGGRGVKEFEGTGTKDKGRKKIWS